MSSRFSPATRPPAQRLDGLARPLLLRPLIWLCVCVVVGVSLGGEFARELWGYSREDVPLWMLLPLVLGGLGLSWLGRKNAWLLRTGIAVTLVALFAGYTARRLLPPRADVSWLVSAPNREEPLHAARLRVVGLIADYPQRSRWNVRFPLEVERVEGKARSGRIWVSVPFDSRLEVGDRLELATELRPLLRPGTPGEREEFWAQIGARCWCENGPLRELQILQPGAAFPLERRVQGVRRALLHRYESLFSSNEDGLYNRPFPLANAALLTAMVWGESGLTQPLPQQTRDDFRVAGLSHLLVASGSQITVGVLLFTFLARLFHARRGWLLAFLIPALTAYVLLVGATPSIWRAAAFGVLGALCLVCGRDMDGLSLWSAGLIGLLLLDPALGWNLSLQLTFAAVWGLIVVSPLVFRFVGQINAGSLGQLVSLSLGAQAATWPLSALHFGTSSIVGLGANLLAVPLAGFLVIGGAIALVIPWGTPLYLLTDTVHSVASTAAHFSGAQIEGASLSNAQCLLFYGALALMPLPFAEDWNEWKGTLVQRCKGVWDGARSLQPKTVCILLIVVAISYPLYLNWPKPQTLRVTMLDVGQGQCIVVQDPSGHAALVDGGSLDGKERADIGETVIVPALQSLGVTRLDYVFLTSPDDDHCNGLRQVLHEVPVGAFIDGPRAAERPNSQLLDELGQAQLLSLRRDVERQKVPIIVPKADEKYVVGDTRIHVLGPALPLSASQNDNSLVLKIEWQERSVLLASDLEAEGERNLVHRGTNLRCDVLQLGRHGSNSSSTPDFLRATSPGAALVSCGRFNRLDVPAPTVLSELSRRSIPLFRTDLDGALSIECDQSACRITPQNP